MNLGKSDFIIRHHDRIAQMVIAKAENAEFSIEEELTDTVRGTGGFGSTGVGK
jgi:dUTP pyrophosphatase